jgi:phosphosulfolactate phosphohydrolase-like enzyme
MQNEKSLALATVMSSNLVSSLSSSELVRQAQNDNTAVQALRHHQQRLASLSLCADLMFCRD